MIGFINIFLYYFILFTKFIFLFTLVTVSFVTSVIFFQYTNKKS
ncbi:hypothetical protein HMPREF0352_2205 [Enterococcus faecium TX1330]|nr:hypothetical protein HMPREF0352_2205 [Enterococcus faecium TX1330]EJV52002.1 hypothetical protein HMPREF1345_01537 [Enterococcus faecium TX1337RF]MBL5010173.1 hypothetical protein [Enterococcus lactis]MBL5015880.1 hypothetical protein [Enterococcus lactis]